MSFEDLKVRISMMLEEATHQPEDLHEAYDILREQIEEIRSLNGTVPEDLLDLQKVLSRKLRKPK